MTEEEKENATTVDAPGIMVSVSLYVRTEDGHEPLEIPVNVNNLTADATDEQKQAAFAQVKAQLLKKFSDERPDSLGSFSKVIYGPFKSIEITDIRELK